MAKKTENQLNSLGERVRYLRSDLTQSEFADILRIKQAMISRYEANKETPSPKVLLRIAQFSGRSIEWLLTGQETIPSAASEAEAKVKRLGAKSTRQMSKDDLIEVAGGYLRDTRYPEAEEFAQMMRALFSDRKSMRKVLDFYRYLRFEDNVGSRK